MVRHTHYDAHNNPMIVDLLITPLYSAKGEFLGVVEVQHDVTQMVQMPPPYRAYFVNLDTGEEISWSGTWGKRWEPVPVPPGRYRLDWWEAEHQTQRMTLAEELVIPAHTLVEIEL